ncbi:5-oxoprolinase subunit B family protein [Silicimonas sp. MF1-12-2]|uniref:5-oxoprolinase subunit B family protein n=1 Tax=Silicimonas sp. MF1-12-2 TaxID=3384793 RepID=UPI0039B64347
MTEPSPEILPLGLDGILVRFADTLSEAANRAALSYRGALEHDLPTGITETATSLTSVLVRFRPGDITRARLQDELRDRLSAMDWYHAPLPEGRTLWRMPAVFGGDYGPQLDEVADAIGRTPDQAVAEIAVSELRVLALGFAPGQPYLGFMDEHWNIPRQTEVTPEVPRGAVVVAVRQVIPFANAAPTGWRQIGRTAFRCYARNGTPPIPLKAGDTVRFEPVPAKDFARLSEAGPLGGAMAEPIE